MDIQKIGHVAIRTADLDRLLAFYTGLLGLPETLRYLYDDGSTLCLFLRATDTQYVEVFPYGRGDQAPTRFDTAINHFCFIVPDLDATAETLARAGIVPTRELATPEGRVLFIHDPDGNMVELMGPGSDAFQRAAADAVMRGEPSVVVRTTTVRPPETQASRTPDLARR
jgi:lactoylglutathione lyase